MLLLRGEAPLAADGYEAEPVRGRQQPAQDEASELRREVQPERQWLLLAQANTHDACNQKPKIDEDDDEDENMCLCSIARRTRDRDSQSEFHMSTNQTRTRFDSGSLVLKAILKIG